MDADIEKQIESLKELEQRDGDIEILNNIVENSQMMENLEEAVSNYSG